MYKLIQEVEFVSIVVTANEYKMTSVGPSIITIKHIPVHCPVFMCASSNLLLLYNDL